MEWCLAANGDMTLPMPMSRAPYFFVPYVVSWHLINRVLSTYNKMCTYSTRMLLFRRLQSPCTRDLPSIFRRLMVGRCMR